MKPEDVERMIADQMRSQQEAQRRAAMQQPPPFNIVPISPQKYTIIAAIEKTLGGFSYKGEIPWYYPEDFKFFREQTEGHCCVMGRHTYNDINKRLGEKATYSVLPNRKCFVVSNTLTSLPNATVIPNITAVEYHTDDIDTPVYIIGGRRLFIEAMAFVDTLLLTFIDKSVECDMYFPIKNINKNFIVESVTPAENKELVFVKYKRNYNK